MTNYENSYETNNAPGFDEVEYLQDLGLERVATSNFLTAGNDLLIEKHPDSQRFYVPFGRIDNERIESIRVSDTFMGRDTDRVCLHVMEQTASKGEEREFLEFTSGGSGGPMREKDDVAGSSKAILSELSQKGLGEQLEESGFERELDEDTTSIMRYSDADGEVVAVLESDRLKGIFAPMDQVMHSHYNIGPQELDIVGVSEVPEFYDTDPTSTSLRVSNGWAEFTIDSRAPSLLKDSRMIREPSLEELGITSMQEFFEQSGFVQGGVNDTETIRGLESINGVSINRLEAYMRPRELSATGFLGEDESLIDVLARDNEQVLAHDLTHQDLALPLRYIEKLYEQGMIKIADFQELTTPGFNEITFDGHPYRVAVLAWRGYQGSPFCDETKTDHDFTVLNLETGQTVGYSALLVEMIPRYGFYEGTGTSYRTPPEDIINTFAHLRSDEQSAKMEDDPVCMIATGRADTAVLNNIDQVTRFRNLYETELPSVREADVAIRLSSSSDLLAFFKNEANEALLPHLDTNSLHGLEPGFLRLETRRNTQTFVRMMEQLDEETQQQIIDLVSTLDIQRQESWTGSPILQKIFESSAQKVDDS